MNQELFKEEFKTPELSFILDMPPMAHKETQPDRRGFMRTDPDKRAYMIEAADKLREYEGWFKGVKYLFLNVVFVCARTETRPTESGIPRVYWNDDDVELMKRSRPDCDNYLKSLQDILSNHLIQKKQRSKATYQVLSKEIKGAGIVDDDSDFVTIKVSKIYASRRNPAPRIEVTIKERGFIFKRKKA